MGEAVLLAVFLVGMVLGGAAGWLVRKRSSGWCRSCGGPISPSSTAIERRSA